VNRIRIIDIPPRLRIGDIRQVKMYIYRGKKFINLTTHPIVLQVNNHIDITIPTSGISIKIETEYELAEINKTNKLFKLKYLAQQKWLNMLKWLKMKYPDVVLLGSILAAYAYPKLVYAVMIVKGLEKEKRQKKKGYWDKFIVIERKLVETKNNKECYIFIPTHFNN